MNTPTRAAFVRRFGCALAAVLALAGRAHAADAATESNLRTNEIVAAAALATHPANRVMALVHTAAYDAANAIARRYPGGPEPLAAAPADASIDAAIAAAHRSALLRLLPAQQPAIDAAYRSALAKVPDGPGRDAGVAVGERAAALVLARRAEDGSTPGPDPYRPHASPGVWVPTMAPVGSQWAQRKPWHMASASQFRPPAPPPLTSERWARDYNEIKALGAQRSSVRSAEQTEIARFWETTTPPIYHGLVRSVADMPGRDVLRNARLYATVTQGLDDALIAVLDAKYHHGLWRPVTAIRNGDNDGNPATDRDATWTPLLNTPMHPEYPCAHCIQAAVVGAVLQAELGSTSGVLLTTTSPTATAGARRWGSIDAVVQEVSNARVWAGVHYRFSTEASQQMGRHIGALAAQALGLAPH